MADCRISTVKAEGINFKHLINVAFIFLFRFRFAFLLRKEYLCGQKK